MEENNLNKTRREIAIHGTSELDVRENLPDAQDLWRQIQNLKKEMNIAKRKAAEEAAKPFMEQIHELEEEYAFVLKLMGS
jgi:hypothetical protein